MKDFDLVFFGFMVHLSARFPGEQSLSSRVVESENNPVKKTR